MLFECQELVLKLYSRPAQIPMLNLPSKRLYDVTEQQALFRRRFPQRVPSSARGSSQRHHPFAGEPINKLAATAAFICKSQAMTVS
jgi:hypothetical protein